MEDKNLNPDKIPQDMPALDLNDFAEQPQQVETLEPLFEALLSDAPNEDPLQHLPAEESAAEAEPLTEELPAGSDPVEEVAVPDAATLMPADTATAAVDSEQPLEEVAAADTSSDETVEAVPVAGESESHIDENLDTPPVVETSEISDELPPRDFAEFDIPMDDPVTEAAAISEHTPVPAEPTPALDNTVIFDLNQPEGTGYSDSMEQLYQEEPVEFPPEVEEEATDIQMDPAPAPAPQPTKSTEEPRPVRKARPKAKKGDGLWGIPHLLATLLWLAIIVAIGVSLGRMLWLGAADVLAFGRESKEVVITINANDTIDDIAQKLHEKGLIKYPGLFKLYAGIAVDEGEIAPGTYTLDTILDYHALVGSMSSSSSHRAVVEDVLIPEGYNCRQIFELLEQNGICTVAELEEYAANGEFQEFWFLEGVERGNKYCLEGFLFPDTYDFYAGSTPREALGKMLLGFNSRIDQEDITTQLAALNERLSAKMKANGCNEEFIAENQISLYELLTVASLIEEETAGASESPTIASVIYNRLTQNEVYERYLGIDAAIIYATGDAENIDTGIDSPYNTYINAGLTPTPISNPGLSSINAALDFEDTDYYYYVLNPETQLHQFSKTYEEHQEWVEKFRGDGE